MFLLIYLYRRLKFFNGKTFSGCCFSKKCVYNCGKVHFWVYSEKIAEKCKKKAWKGENNLQKCAYCEEFPWTFVTFVKKKEKYKFRHKYQRNQLVVIIIVIKYRRKDVKERNYNRYNKKKV